MAQFLFSPFEDRKVDRSVPILDMGNWGYMLYYNPLIFMSSIA
jgi:hypothetical protein